MQEPAPPPRGSILVIVMITLLFAAAALVAFLEKASNDLLVAAREQEAARLRPDAYSALEVTLAVLEDFIYADNGLHSPAEGWGDPLGWAGWQPSDGASVAVSLSDESGKIPLIHANSVVLMNLFENQWGMAQDDAQRLTDELLSWMQQNYVPVTALDNDYGQSPTPYAAPLRAMRSYGELAAIDDAKDLFYDKATGRPSALWWRFYGDFSLFNYRAPNINSANPDVLASVGQFSPDQQQAISDFLAGRSELRTLGRTWFLSATDLGALVGSFGNVRSYAYTVSALRILITVTQGKAVYRLSAVVAPSQGGARTVETTATDVQNGSSNSGTGETNTASTATAQSMPTTSPNAAQQAAAAQVNIRFPFTILEILENDEIPTPPPASPS